jgi:hypothetical protein
MLRGRKKSPAAFRRHVRAVFGGEAGSTGAMHAS